MQEKPVFLDTTIHIDLVLKEKPPQLLEPLHKLLEQFSFRVTCMYSRLEFKRALIKRMSLILDYLCEEGSYWGALQRASRHPRAPRRVATMVNILAWLGFAVEKSIDVKVGDSLDSKLVLQAKAFLRNAIPYVWKRFEHSVDSIVDRTECKRAIEKPRKMRNGAFDATIHEQQCTNRQCNIVNFFRSELPRLKKLKQRLEELAGLTNGKLTKELKSAKKAIESAISSPARLFNYKNCIEIGDVWLHLESIVAGVKDFATTNYKESEVLCPTLGLVMRQP